MKRLLVCMFVVAACGTQRIDICHMDSDCTNPAFGFCDVNGEYPAADGEKNVCTITPSNCPPERCGCTPGAETCTSTSLTVCNTDGKSATTTNCVLGCATDGTRCADFAPSNGLADALAMADDEADVDLPANVGLGDQGVITNEANGSPIAIRSISVAQVGVPAIRVYIAHSFKIHAGMVFGYADHGGGPVAFVSTGPIIIDGDFDAGAIGVFDGAGSQSTTAPCAGASFHRGGGGGGNGTAGGDGAPNNTLPVTPGAQGGLAQPANAFEPLVGGCPGGANGNTSMGGVGGGGLELVSRTSITVASTGAVNLGGAGGDDDGGGGAGGNLLLESPMVVVDGNITANGGSGGACGLAGNPGSKDATPAMKVGGCMGSNGVTQAFSGAGGTAVANPGPGVADTTVPGAAGGGAVGRVEIKTTDGMFVRGAAAIISAIVSTTSLTPE